MIHDLFIFPFVGQQMVQECTLPSTESEKASWYLIKISIFILFVAEFVFFGLGLNCEELLPSTYMVFRVHGRRETQTEDTLFLSPL